MHEADPEPRLTLFHGTTSDSAKSLLQRGWMPHSHPAGNHCGNTGLLYLTTEHENALWYAQEKGGDAVLSVEISISALMVDPEDGVGETVVEELRAAESNGLPANFATSHPIEGDRFILTKPHEFRP